MKKALDWWHSITFIEKCEKCIKWYTTDKMFTSGGVYSLTDEEIFFIYSKENP